MNQLLGIIYIIYFISLGYGFRVAFNKIKQQQLIIENKTDFFAHAFFQGVFIHVVIFNLFQLLNLSNSTVLVALPLLLLVCMALIFWHILHKGLQGQTFVPKLHNVLITTVLLLMSAFIYWNGSLLPNIAWDSWAVWEGKAQQWVEHGLNVDIMAWNDWVNEDTAIFNASANYPDGLSLIYFLPKVLFQEGFAITQIVVLFAFAMMTLLLISRIAKLGAPVYLQLAMVLVIYTTPFISNHLMIQGYADIWLAMFILLVMLSLMDYIDDNNMGIGLTIICYLAMLPMLKLEGWVWLLLFFMAYGLTLLSTHKSKYKVLAGVAGVILALVLLGGIDLNFSFGNITITHERITLLNLFDLHINFVNITEPLLISFLWQNNWSLLWLGLPFLLFTFFSRRHSLASQVSHVFLILALGCMLFLFYFTEASRWAQDFTAINRIVLQLTPCYLFLLFKMIVRIKGIQAPTTKQQSSKTPE